MSDLFHIQKVKLNNPKYKHWQLCALSVCFLLKKYCTTYFTTQFHYVKNQNVHHACTKFQALSSVGPAMSSPVFFLPDNDLNRANLSALVKEDNGTYIGHFLRGG